MGYPKKWLRFNLRDWGCDPNPRTQQTTFGS